MSLVNAPATIPYGTRAFFIYYYMAITHTDAPFSYENIKEIFI